MGTGLGPQYTGPLQHQQCAKNQFDALYPELFEGLASTFSPMVIVPPIRAILLAKPTSGRRWSILPTDHETFDKTGLPIFSYRGLDTQPGASIRTGLAAASGMMIGDKKDANRNGPMAAPLTVHAYVRINQVATDVNVWGTSIRTTAKGGGKDYGFKMWLGSSNKDVNLEAHDGTTAGNGLGQRIAGGFGLWSAGDHANIVISAQSEPLSAAAGQSNLWVNGVDVGVLANNTGKTAVHTSSANFTTYGGRKSGLYANDLEIHHVATWRRMLTKWEHELLSNDPLALYRKRPQSKSYFYPPWHVTVKIPPPTVWIKGKTLLKGNAVIK